MFSMFFPTGTRPAVGQHVTVPAGAPPTGTTAQETLISTLIQFGNAADGARHCDLVARAMGAAPTARPRTWFLNGGAPGGLWTTDVDAEAQISTATLRLTAGGPITFLCVTIGSGPRLGGDLDGDTHRNGSDCSDGDPAFFQTPASVGNLLLDSTGILSWDPQVSTVGPVFHEVAGGMLSGLTAGLTAATSCVSGSVTGTTWTDARPAPSVGDGYYYLVRARTMDCNGGFGASTTTIETLDCTGN